MTGAGKDAGGSIRAIDREAVHRICSGQVVLDLATAVKELVENSLDAGATVIEVRIREHGLHSVEVVDNGGGIEPSNYASVALKHYTSKLRTFDDLDSVGSFGFRGEALSSLCAIAELSVTTRTVEQSLAMQLSFDRSGQLVGQAPAARPVGTTVAVRGLFEPLPVRRAEFQRNAKRDYARCIAVLTAYALSCTGVKLSCWHVTAKGPRARVLGTDGAPLLRDNIVSLFGPRQMASLLPLDVRVPLAGAADALLTGFISAPTHGSGRGSADRHFIFVNGRPADLPRLSKVIHEAYHAFNAAQFPFVIVQLQLPSGSFDVNVTPDKRTLLIHDERSIADALRQQLLDVLMAAAGAMPVAASVESSDGGTQSLRSRDTESSSAPDEEDAVDADALAPTPSSLAQPAAAFAARKAHSDPTPLVRAERAPEQRRWILGLDLARKSRRSAVQPQKTLSLGHVAMNGAARIAHSDDKAETDEGDREPVDGAEGGCVRVDDVPSAQAPPADAAPAVVEVDTTITPDACRNADVLSDVAVDTSSMLADMRARLAGVLAETPAAPAVHGALFRLTLQEVSQREAERELSRLISKEDFLRMDLVGQFNLGFIVVRLEHDLFIVDQHASDEKYNFELLQRDTVLHSQPLVVPQILELAAAEEAVLEEHLDVFRRSGFEVRIDPDGEPTRRARLVAKPMSHECVLGINELHEMLAMLRERPEPTARPSRLRAVFAMRACRKSVMIGTALSRPQMKKIVEHMAEMDHPWVRSLIAFACLHRACPLTA